MSIILSYIPKLEINGTVVGFQSLTWDDRTTLVNTSDSETGAYEGREGDRAGAAVTITGLQKTDFTPYSAPLGIYGGATIAIRHWPNGKTAPYDTYYDDIPSFKVSSFAKNESSATGTPQTWTLTGEANGVFTEGRSDGMSEAAILDRTWEFDHQGHPLTLHRPTLTTEREYAQHLRRSAALKFNADRPTVGEQTWRVWTEGLGRDIVAGYYGWQAPGFFASFSDQANVVQFLFLWFRQNQHANRNGQPAISEEEMHELWRTRREELDNMLAEVINDPNPLRA